MRRLTTLFIGIVLTACSLAPDYTPPTSEAPAAFKELGEWQAALPADDAPKGDWWKLFKDPELDQLEARQSSDNQSLKAGLARLTQARAVSTAARADLFPQISAQGSALRLRESQTLPHDVKPWIYNDDKLALDVSYEVDLWGRVRNSVEAAKDEAQASTADFAILELSLRTELAAVYFSLQGADSSQQILDQTVIDDQAALDLIDRRHDGGVATWSDVVQARSQLEQAKTQAADMQLKRSQLEHAIAILVGVPPAQFQLPPKPLAATPPAIAVGLPSTLLERRPDIAAAERRVAAANARIGVTRAAWYPHFNLGGLIGLEGAYPQTLLQASSAIWAFGPQTLAQNVFDGGRRDAQIDQAKSGFDAAVADYRQTTLTAWGEVEDQLAALRQLEREAQTQDRAVAAQTEALAQSRYRYRAGIVTYLDVVVNQNNLLADQLKAADIRLRRIKAAILLIKDLGGGWQEAQAN